MATFLELAKIKHHAVRSDGAKFLNGERNDALDTSWLSVSNGQVTLSQGVYDELLVVKGEVSDERIKAWAAMNSPFYDTASNIVYEGAGGLIEMDRDGMRFIRTADGKKTFEIDTETGSAFFRGDITGASGTFADGRVAIGDIGGKPWGDSALPSGTAGIWGDDAGLYLRGYANTIMVGYAQDEEVLDISGYNPGNPQIIVAPKTMLTYWPQQPNAVPVIFTDATMIDIGKYKITAKTMIQGAYNSLPIGLTEGTTVAGAWQQPQSRAPNNNKGVDTNFIQCRVGWFASGGHTVKVWQYVSNEFNANGDPVNWVQKRYFTHTGPLFSSHSGTLNWDLVLPQDQWAVRVVWQGHKAPIGIIYAECRVNSAGYKTTTYLDINGNSIAADMPSGMDVMYYVFDRG